VVTLDLLGNMAATPAHINAARGDPSYCLLSLQDFIRVRKLYLEKRYKNCIAVAGELLNNNPPPLKTKATTDSRSLHPIHEAHLLFHQALSHECLGIAAHKFSANKLSFLREAGSEYKTALATLPLQFTTDEDGVQDPLPNDSPDIDLSFDLSRIDESSMYIDDTPMPVRVASEVPSMRVSEESTEEDGESFLSQTSATSVGCDPQCQDDEERTGFEPKLQETPVRRMPSKSPGLTRSEGRQQLAFVEPPDEAYGSEHDSDSSESSEDNDSEEERNPSWLPRSSFSLNLAAHDLETSSEESEETQQVEDATLTKASLTTPLNNMPQEQDRHADTSRLSSSLSSSHVLCTDLVPSPLFSRGQKKLALLANTHNAAVSTPNSPKTTELIPTTPSTSLQPRPLFAARKTAVQTLISRFEGKIVLPDDLTPTYSCDAAHISSQNTHNAALQHDSRQLCPHPRRSYHQSGHHAFGRISSLALPCSLQQQSSRLPHEPHPGNRARHGAAGRG
jgi:hypothetical protein